MQKDLNLRSGVAPSSRRSKPRVRAICNADDDDDEAIFCPEISVRDDDKWPVVVANACT